MSLIIVCVCLKEKGWIWNSILIIVMLGDFIQQEAES